MTLDQLNERLKTSKKKTLYFEQKEALMKRFGEKTLYHAPVSSSKEKIVAALEEDDFYILHANGKLDRKYIENEDNFYGLYYWFDGNKYHVIVATL